MAADDDEWRAKWNEKTLAALHYLRDASVVAGKKKLAVLASVIREKEEAAQAELFERHNDLNLRSVSHGQIKDYGKKGELVRRGWLPKKTLPWRPVGNKITAKLFIIWEAPDGTS